MKSLKDREAVIAAWLDDGPATLPPDTRRAISVGIRAVPRRRPAINWPFGLGRLGLPTIHLRQLSVALGSAVVVVVGAALAVDYADLPGAGGPPPATDPRTSVDPSTEPTTATNMWPQLSLEEVREAQALADAGDPAYTWQVDPRLRSQQSDPMETDPELWGYLTSPGTAIVERFLREELGWEEFLFSGEATDRVVDPDGLRGLVYLRCAPDGINPLYPVAPDGNQQARSGERCAPTIDELAYEAVRLDLFQPDRQGLDGIWVVSGWTTTRFAQADPSVVEAEATARLEDFLRARIEGVGAEGYVQVFDFLGEFEDVPLLYATTTGAPYERFEIEQRGEPEWPDGDMVFTVRLFAEGGTTVVEQLIYVFFENGRPTFRHNAANTTENGQPLAVPSSFSTAK